MVLCLTHTCHSANTLTPYACLPSAHSHIRYICTTWCPIPFSAVICLGMPWSPAVSTTATHFLLAFQKLTWRRFRVPINLARAITKTSKDTHISPEIIALAVHRKENNFQEWLNSIQDCISMNLNIFSLCPLQKLLYTWPGFLTFSVWLFCGQGPALSWHVTIENSEAARMV